MGKKARTNSKGIACQAENCIHYQNGAGCTAPQIEITNRDAMTSAQTQCETFVPQSFR